MAKWNFKSCPRCNGDTFIEKEIDGWIERCLLCGYSRELRISEVPASKNQQSTGVS